MLFNVAIWFHFGNSRNQDVVCGILASISKWCSIKRHNVSISRGDVFVTYFGTPIDLNANIQSIFFSLHWFQIEIRLIITFLPTLETFTVLVITLLVVLLGVFLVVFLFSSSTHRCCGFFQSWHPVENVHLMSLNNLYFE